MKRLSTVLAILSIGMVLSCCGCGYTTRSAICADYKTIYIAPFLNKVDITEQTDVASKYKIFRPYVETDVTRAVVNNFLFDGNLKPIKSEYADLVLKGEIREFRKDPLRYSESDDVAEYRVNIIVNLKMYRRNQDLLWQEDGFTGQATYFTSGSLATSEASCINEAITDLARRVVERTVEQW